MTTKFENAYGTCFYIPHVLADFESNDWEEVMKSGGAMWGFAIRWITDAGYSIRSHLDKEFKFEDDGAIERAIFDASGEQPLAVTDEILARFFTGLGESPPIHVHMYARISLAQDIEFWRARLGDGKRPLLNGPIAIPSFLPPHEDWQFR